MTSVVGISSLVAMEDRTPSIIYKATYFHVLHVVVNFVYDKDHSRNVVKNQGLKVFFSFIFVIGMG